MSYASCEDCGSRLEKGGVCPNCHEELFIATTQAEYMEPISQEFYDKVLEQVAAVKTDEAGRGMNGEI